MSKQGGSRKTHSVSGREHLYLISPRRGLRTLLYHTFFSYLEPHPTSLSAVHKWPAFRYKPCEAWADAVGPVFYTMPSAMTFISKFDLFINRTQHFVECLPHVKGHAVIGTPVRTIQVFYTDFSFLSDL